VGLDGQYRGLIWPLSNFSHIIIVPTCNISVIYLLSLSIVSSQDYINFGLCMTLYVIIEPVHLLQEVTCNSIIV